MSRNDSLVGFRRHSTHLPANSTTNKSFQLVGGFSFPPHPPTCSSNHQRVFMTRWWVLLASLPLHTCCRPPTSHCDSLVVFRRLCTLLQPPTSCYSSLAGYPRQSPIFTPAANHQRVTMTRWWLFIASAPSFNHQ